MIGEWNTQERKVTVIGAGISGLLIADRLDQLGFEVTLIEKSNRAGGLIETRETPYGMAETAAHSLLATEPVLKLCDRLGVELVEVNPHSRSRFIWRTDRPRRVPLGPFELLGTLMRVLFKRALSHNKPLAQGDQSLEEWALRHVGPSALRYIINPFVTGVFAVFPKSLSVSAAFPNLVVSPGQTLFSTFLKLKRKRTNGQKPRMMTPKGGMGWLVDALDVSLTSRLGDRYRKGSEIITVPNAPNVVFTLPAEHAAHLFENSKPALSRLLKSIQYAPLVSCTVFFETTAFDKIPRGVGILIPTHEDSDILGILFNSSSFVRRTRDEGIHSFSVMLGGEKNPSAVELSDEEITDIIRIETVKILGVKAAPVHVEINRWKRAIPIYSPELKQVWAEAESVLGSGQILFGNYSGQVSIRGMIEKVSELQI